MGYASSLDAVERVKAFLVALKNSNDDQLAWLSDNPKTLQYNIHCGLATASAIRHEVYGDLKKIWRIRIKDKLVIAERKIPLQKIEAALLFEDVGDVFGIVTKLTLYKDSESVLTFTNVDLNEEDLGKLQKWCDANERIFRLNERTLNVSRLS